jgi:hypothetical protein
MITDLKKPNITVAPLAALLWVFLTSALTASAFYDPGSQRWINRDPIEEGGGVNLYTFVDNGPMTWIDAAGLIAVRKGSKSHVQCDGNGHYEIILSNHDWNSKVRKCVEQHEQDHINDYKKRYGESSCQKKRKGEFPSEDLPGEPAGGYERWHDQSECDAYTAEVECDEKILRSCPARDRPDVQIERNSDRRQRDYFCGLAKKAKAK